MIKKPYLLVFLGGLMAGATLIWTLYPRVEERVEYKDKVVTKVEVRTRIVERKQPGGATETITEILDTEVTNRDTSLVALKAAQKQFLVGVGVSTNWDRVKADYNVHVARRVVGPFLAGVSVGTDRRVEAALYFEF